MNILILNWRDPKHPNAGGAEIVTWEYAKGWVKAGYTVTLFSSFYDGCKEREVLDGITIIRRGSQVFGIQIYAFLWYIFEDHTKFDLVIDQFHGIPFFTPLYVRTKKLAFIHEVAKDVWKLNPWPKPLNLIPYIIGTLGEPWIFRMFYRNTFFLTVSESTRKDLVQWGIPRKHISIIHNGVIMPTGKITYNKEKKKTVIFLGALAKDKGVEDALRVFSLISQKESGWQFWLVGKGDEKYMEKLKKLAKNLHIQGLTFFGFVSEKKKFELLKKSYILINPSVREGWGLVNIEANAVGTPVVAYDVPGCRDSVKNNITGKLVREGDYYVMASVTRDLINKKSKYKKFSENALKWSEKFMWKKALKDSLTLLRKNYILNQ